MTSSHIVAGARTPIGKMSGAFSTMSAAQLGSVAIAGALERAGVDPAEVDHVVMGQVLMAGQGQVPARQAAAGAGIPMGVPSVNVNKVCLSGLNAIYLAHQMIMSGDADIVVAGGMESMTNAPHLLAGARGGYRYGNTELEDAIIKDGLWCAFDACLMGTGTEQYADGSIARAEQDRIAAESHERAADATKNGRLADEIIPVEVPQRRGDAITVSEDEGIRADTTEQSLAGLRGAFGGEGTIQDGEEPQKGFRAGFSKTSIAARLSLFRIILRTIVSTTHEFTTGEPSIRSLDVETHDQLLATVLLNADTVSPLTPCRVNTIRQIGILSLAARIRSADTILSTLGTLVEALQNTRTSGFFNPSALFT